MQPLLRDSSKNRKNVNGFGLRRVSVAGRRREPTVPTITDARLAPMPTITDADVIDEDVTPEQLRAMSLDEEQRGMAMQIAMEQQAEELQAVAR